MSVRSRPPFCDALARAALVGVVLAIGCTEGGLREDVLLCEEAVAHLAECCPDLDPLTFACRYHAGACSTTYPDFNSQQADCITDRTCAQLVADGFCADGDAGAERAATAAARRVCSP